MDDHKTHDGTDEQESTQVGTRGNGRRKQRQRNHADTNKRPSLGGLTTRIAIDRKAKNPHGKEHD